MGDVGEGLQEREMILTCWITAQIFWLGAEQKFRTTIKGFFLIRRTFFFFFSFFNETLPIALCEQKATFPREATGLSEHIVSPHGGTCQHTDVAGNSWGFQCQLYLGLSALPYLTTANSRCPVLDRKRLIDARSLRRAFRNILPLFLESLLLGTNISFRTCGAVLPGTPPDL